MTKFIYLMVMENRRSSNPFIRNFVCLCMLVLDSGVFPDRTQLNVRQRHKAQN